ncbi:hypothetical protein [Streptomyces sp. NPDC020192]|uniref:hypothetical protein n=1 Tax=Streptomyces sp. NPDC020192 TaxID=3365066 RepID=UPI0037B101FF
MEAEDATVEAARHRKVFEDLGGTVECAELVCLITGELDSAIDIAVNTWTILSFCNGWLCVA